MTGEEILRRLREWLAEDDPTQPQQPQQPQQQHLHPQDIQEKQKEDAFLCASVLLQQGFLVHPSMGVLIDSPIVAYGIKDPVLTHYARCMRRGLAKQCTHRKKNGTAQKNKKCEGCFSGTEGVDWMLLNFTHLVKKLRVESMGNAIAVGVALVEEGVLEDVKQKSDAKKLKPFLHTDKKFYRFKSRLFKSRPVGGQTLALNPLPAQLEFIACRTVLEGLKPVSQYTCLASSTSFELPTVEHVPLIEPNRKRGGSS